MRKPTLLLGITLLSTSLQAATPPTKTQAYFKICYGMSALFAGAVVSPVMGGVHLALGQTLSTADNAVGKIKGKLTKRLNRRPFLARLRRSTVGSQLLSVASRSEKVIGIGTKASATLLNTSGHYYLAMPIFLVPLGMAMIQAGREDLHQMQIASDKATKS